MILTRRSNRILAAFTLTLALTYVMAGWIETMAAAAFLLASFAVLMWMFRP